MVSSRPWSLRWPPRGMQRSSPTVYGCRGCSKISRAGPCSTSSPAYITPTRSHIFAITARLWLMNRIAVWNSSRSADDELEDLGLDGGVERRGRLVQDQQAGLGGQGHRDDDALQHPAGELVGIGAQHPPGSEICTLRSASSARADASDLPSPAISKTSATWRPTLIDGFSARPGSWYTMDTVRARSLRSASLPSARLLAGHGDRPLAHPPVPREVADDGQGHGRLAAAGLADQPERFLLPDLERDVPDRQPVVAAHRVGHVDVRDIHHQRVGELVAGRRRTVGRSLDSTASIESAMRLIATTSEAIASAGNSTSHQYPAPRYW